MPTPRGATIATTEELRSSNYSNLLKHVQTSVTNTQDILVASFRFGKRQKSTIGEGPPVICHITHKSKILCAGVCESFNYTEQERPTSSELSHTSICLLFNFVRNCWVARKSPKVKLNCHNCRQLLNPKYCSPNKKNRQNSDKSPRTVKLVQTRLISLPTDVFYF